MEAAKEEETKGSTTSREEGVVDSTTLANSSPSPRYKENVVLVLGATGKTGQNLVNQLADKQVYNVRVLVRYRNSKKNIIR